jgi:hypothetical protein
MAFEVLGVLISMSLAMGLSHLVALSRFGSEVINRTSANLLDLGGGPGGWCGGPVGDPRAALSGTVLFSSWLRPTSVALTTQLLIPLGSPSSRSRTAPFSRGG